MKIRISTGLSVLTLAAIAAFAVAPAAEAKTYQLHFDLTGKAETPPNTTKGKGHGTASYDDQTHTLSYKITYSGLTGDATAAHFHGPADAKTNAGVVVPVPMPASGGMMSPLKGEATLTDAQAADLAAGKWYFNIHTAANKGGEIRGQVMKGGM